jgi:hypothetical protein
VQCSMSPVRERLPPLMLPWEYVWFRPTQRDLSVMRI